MATHRLTCNLGKNLPLLILLKRFVASSPEETMTWLTLTLASVSCTRPLNGGIADISRNRIIEHLKQMEASSGSNPATKVGFFTQSTVTRVETTEMPSTWA